MFTYSIAGTTVAIALVGFIVALGTATNPAIATPLAATRLAITMQPSSAIQVGVPFPQQPTIQLRDASGRNVSEAGIVITALIATGGGTLIGSTTATTGATGAAPFTGLAITGTLGVHTLLFTAPSLIAVTTGNLTLGGGPATALSIATQPSLTPMADHPFPVQPAIQLRDGSGNEARQAGVVVTAAIVGEGRLSGNVTATTNAAGLATFTDLTVDGAVNGERTLSFSAPSLTGVTSASVTLNRGSTLSGVVSTADGVPIGGGTIELTLGGAVPHSVVVGSDGKYSIPSLVPATYRVQLDPPLTHSLGAGESGIHTVTVGAGATATQSFTVQPAVWFDDFQSYASTRQLLSGCDVHTNPPGAFFVGEGRDLHCDTSNHLSLDPNGGNSTGPKALRYDWAAKPAPRPLGSYCSAENTTALMPRFVNPPVIPDTLWIRFTSKESPGFLHGAKSCAATAGISYKFFLINIGPTVNGGANGRLGVGIVNSLSNTLVPPALSMDMNDRTHFPPNAVSRSLGNNFFGTYHTWVVQAYNLGTNATTVRTYLDGVQVDQVTGPFFPGVRTFGGHGQYIMLEMGANINNGPEQPQSRWFRDIGVYLSRPSMRPIPP